MITLNQNEFTLAAAQSSSVKGDIAQNERRHGEFVIRAAGHQANVIVFPELSLTGYQPTLAAELTLGAGDAQRAPCAIWDESGAMVAQAGATAESLATAQATPSGWTGRRVELQSE